MLHTTTTGVGIWIVALLLSIFCARNDLVLRIIPNRFSYPALFVGLILAWVLPSLIFRDHLLGLGLAGGLFLLLWFPGAVGGGDVKMMAALGALLGWPVIGEVIFWTAVAGGVLALLVLMFGKIPWIDRYEDPRGEDVPRRKKSLPYGVAIAIGTYVTFFLTVFG